MDATPENSAGSKAIFAAKALAALLAQPAGAMLLSYEAAGHLDGFWILISHVFLSLLTVIAAIILRLFARGWWARLRIYFFLAWMVAVPVAIFFGMGVNALLHWGGPPS